MPSFTILYDENAKPLFELCKLHRNTIKLSKNKRIMLVGGFGNLSGEFDIYDMK